MPELVETVVTGRPAWRHEPSGVLFRRVPAGHFRMGLSDEELDAVDAMLDDEDPQIVWYPGTAAECRPAHWVAVPTFLLAWRPLTVAQARHFRPGHGQRDRNRPGEPAGRRRPGPVHVRHGDVFLRRPPPGRLHEPPAVLDRGRHDRHIRRHLMRARLERGR
jgi:formylglycine-generating enzyme required for sulfatase activity